MDTYAEFKEEAIQNQPRYYKTRLKHFRLESPNKINIEGKKFPLSNDGLDSIRDFVRMPKRFSARMTKRLGDNATISLMDALRKGKANMSEDKQVFVVFDPESSDVKAIKGHYPRLTRKGYFDLVERVIDEFNLDITGFSEDDDGENMLRVKTEKKGEKVRMADVENEVFRAGPAFVSDFGNLGIHSYMLRMVCSNGMILRREEQDFQAKLNREDMTEFFEYMTELEENHFVPESFRDNVYRAMEHPASFRELEQVRNVIRNDGEWTSDDGEVDRFIPYYENVAAYRDVGVDVNEMSHREKRNARTNIEVWDLVNNLTSFATHDPLDIGFSESDEDQMITKAGEILSGKFDTEDLPPQPNFRMN